MKKVMVFLLVLLFLAPDVLRVSANSAPFIWVNYPSSSMMAIDSDTGIEVLKEDLHFDFSLKDEESFSPGASVSAKYEMKNTKDEAEVTSMVFPFFQKMWNTESDDIEVLVDGEKIAYELFYGKEALLNDEDPPMYVMDIENILSSVTRDQYTPEKFNYTDVGMLYRVRADRKAEQSGYLQISFNINESSQKVIASGFNSYGSYGEGEYELGAHLEEGETTAEFYILGGDPSVLNIAIVSSIENGIKKPVDDIQYEVHEESMNLAAYYKEYVTESEFIPSVKMNTLQEENLYFEALDKALGEQAVIMEDMIIMYLGDPRYAMIVYDVPFEAGEEKSVEVRYMTYGTMDRRETEEPTYTYDYFLQPAARWKDFQNLTVKITPSEDYPFIIDSTLPLEREEDGTYSGQFETLPEEDLRFVLYEEEEITAMDRAKGTLSRYQYPIYFIGTLLLSFLVLGVLTLILKKVILKFINKRKEDDR
ncbi:hypothetical protein [Proteiniclasticum sp.]|uniref:hypothetical protein n=1 Tax=Proteiniclasticum sp. TaxID=2053595 RepID=UPI002897D1B4|nr:hypothetical protein [Proteiniclasticum sp.]